MRTLGSILGARGRRDTGASSAPSGATGLGAVCALSNAGFSMSQFGAPPPGGMSYACLDPENGLPWPGVLAVGAQGAVLRSLEFVQGESSVLAFEASRGSDASSRASGRAAGIVRHDLDTSHVRGRWIPFNRFSEVYGSGIPQSFLDMRARVQDKKLYDTMPVLLLAPNDTNSSNGRAAVAVLTPQMRAQEAGLTGTIATDVFNLLNAGYGVAIDASELTDLGRALGSQLAAIAKEAFQTQGRRIVLFNIGQQSSSVADWIARVGEPALVSADSRVSALALAAK